MRTASLCRFAFAPLIAAYCLSLASVAIAGSDQTPASSETSAGGPTWTVPRLINAVRQAEKQFADLETVVKKKRVRPGLAIQTRVRRGKVTTAGGLQEEIATRTVRQGDFFYTKMSISRKGNNLPTLKSERIAAFDGEKTRTIEVGSAINIHDSKTLLVRSLPPHSWPLAIDTPLSDFLSGSSATETRQPPLDSLLIDNFRAPTSAIEPRIAGEETLKGLTCIRLEFEEDDAENGDRAAVHLWLAKDRHLIPVREQVFREAETGQLPTSESRVEDWLEVKNNVWMPKRIVRVTYQDSSAKTRKESRRETILLEKATLDVKYSPEFFRDLNSPPGLPNFTIKEGRLADSFPHPEEQAQDEARLRKIADQLRDEESHYNRLSVDAMELRTTNPLFGGNDKTRTTKMHSLLVGDRALTDAHHETWHFSGSFRPMLWTEAFDGQTYRAYGRHPPPQKGGYSWISSQNFFTNATTLVPVMLRPHSALIPGGSSYRRLADILWPPDGSVPPALEKKVEYLGEAPSGGLPCYVLAIQPARARAPAFKSLLWLAKERNLIPVRFEQYRAGETLPIRLEIVDKFHQPSPGVWYPAHKTRYIFRQQIPPAVRDGYLFVDQCWDYTVQTVSFDPAAPEGSFGQIVVDEGIDVQYFDRNGKLFNKAMQTSDSVPEMPSGK
jgi:hypothetical protein